MGLRPTNLHKFLIGLFFFSMALGLGAEKAWLQGDISQEVVRLTIPNQEGLYSWAKLGIPIFCQIKGSAEEYSIFTQIQRDQRDLIENLGYTVQTIDQNPQGAIYYLAFNPLAKSRLAAPKGIRVLAEVEQKYFIRADPQDAEKLLALGFKIQRLEHHPFILPPKTTSIHAINELTPNPLVQTILDEVDAGELAQYIGDLSGERAVIVNENPYTFFTRYSYATIPIKKATRYTYDHFTALGLTTYYDHFFLLGNEMRSVIAEQPTNTGADCIVLIIGHLDSYSVSDPYGNAPGADDNASGSAGVLTAADILHPHQFECTLRYILFTAEEQGYYGSLYYAQDVAAAEENIRAAINLDMIGYNSIPSPVMEIHIRPDNPADLALANMMTAVIEAYEIDLVPEIVPDGLAWSDHSRFWEYGYPAILVMEDKDGDFTPYYHSTDDRLASIDPNYVRAITQAAIGSAIHLAEYQPPSKIYLPLIITTP